MHGLEKLLLHLRQVDGLLVATLAFHTGRDATNDDNGVGNTHFLGNLGEDGLSRLTLADVATQHGEIASTTTIFEHDIVILAFLHIERLVVGTTSAEAEASETTTSATFAFFDDLAVHLQHITVVGGEGVFHLARERGGVLTADAHGEAVVVDAVGKAPCTEGREVEFVVVAGLVGFALQTSVVPELHKHTLAIVELGQMVHGGIVIVQFASLVVDDLGARNGCLDAFQQRVLVLIGRRSTIVSVQQFHIVGIRTYHSQRLDALRERQHVALVL